MLWSSNGGLQFVCQQPRVVCSVAGAGWKKKLEKQIKEKGGGGCWSFKTHALPSSYFRKIRTNRPFPWLPPLPPYKIKLVIGHVGREGASVIKQDRAGLDRQYFTA